MVKNKKNIIKNYERTLQLLISYYMMLGNSFEESKEGAEKELQFYLKNT